MRVAWPRSRKGVRSEGVWWDAEVDVLLDDDMDEELLVLEVEGVGLSRGGDEGAESASRDGDEIPSVSASWNQRPCAARSSTSTRSVNCKSFAFRVSGESLPARMFSSMIFRLRKPQ
jgi:hypothetical protein